MNGEDIEGTFYEQELQKSKQEIFRIEKIIRSRMKNGKKEILVKWEGYDKSFNSWIPFNAQVWNLIVKNSITGDQVIDNI